MTTPADEIRDTRGRTSVFSKGITSLVLAVLLYVLSTGPVAAVATVHYGSTPGDWHLKYLAPVDWCAARCEAVRCYRTGSEARCFNVYFALVLWWHMAPAETSREDLFEIVSGAPRALACGSPLNGEYSPPAPNP